MLTLGLVTDLHYAELPPLGTRHFQDTLGKLREASDFFRRGGVEVALCLGDLIDNPPDKNVDKEIGYARMMHAILGNGVADRHYVLGNHCVQLLSKGQFLSAVEQKKSYYSFDRAGIHFVILDGCFRADGVDYNAGNFNYIDANIPPPELAWLEKDLEKTKLKTIAFCHQRLDEPKDAKWRLKGRERVRNVFKASGKVAAVFMGHAHENDLQIIDGIPYICLQAMVEGAGVANGAYSIVTVTESGSLTLQGYRQHRDHPLAKRS